MMFDPTKPVFAGKVRLRTTNAVGQKYLLSYTTVGNQTVPTLSSTSTADPSTIWTTYDAGSGSVAIASNVGLYLSVQTGNNLAILLSDASQALPVTLQPSGPSGDVQITWFSQELGQTLIAYYQLGTGLPTTLTFSISVGPDVLSELAQTTTTPGLVAIRSSHSAVGCDLTGVNLNAVDLSGINCTQAHFDNASMSGTVLSGATLTGASFKQVDLTQVLWGQDVSAASADFSGTIGVGMIVKSSGISGNRATFDAATFTGADWSGCDLTNASLHHAFVTGANFSGATLTSAYLYALQAGKSNDGTIPGADFSYAYMPDANLQASNLNGADFSFAQIYFLYRGASLLNADLTETDFTRADLTGAGFGGLASSIAGTIFDSAVLFDAHFDGVNFMLSATGMPVSMVDAWIENATFQNVSFSGVRLNGARVAVTAGAAGAGVPLFAISSGVADYVSALDRSQLPADFTGSSGVFAAAGCALSDAASVTVISDGQCWQLSQWPARTTLGVEDVIFSVVLNAATLEVYASGISLVEQGDGGITYATPYTVAVTALPPTSLSSDTCCPNRTTKRANDALGLSWQQMMTAPRLSLAVLNQVGSARSPVPTTVRRPDRNQRP
jgi:uncharacterized protein YjbI with pentapeptide repeats